MNNLEDFLSLSATLHFFNHQATGTAEKIVGAGLDTLRLLYWNINNSGKENSENASEL